jgi:hypothetical protein
MYFNQIAFCIFIALKFPFVNKSVFTWIILLFCGVSGFAQSEKQAFYGKVIDAETKTPLDNVDILDENSGAGISTDQNGLFKLSVIFPAHITVSHIGYETQTINLQAANDSILIILLKRRSTELPVVSIFPGKAENIIKNNELSVMDYEFIDDNILLLAQSTRFHKPSLILLDEKFDTLTITKLDIHPEFIFHDCMDNLHLVAKDFAFQLNYDRKRIQMLYPVNSDEMIKKLSPCVEKLHDKFYFSEYSKQGLSLLYFFKDSSEKKGNILQVISDRKKQNMVDSEIDFALAPGHKYEEWDKHFFDSMIVSKVYAPLVKMHDTIYIFNFPERKIEYYSGSGKLLNSVEISFHEQRHWKKSIMTDETENKCYAVFEKNGIVQLKEIGLKTGTTESVIDFSGFPFASNIKIRNGYVYFLYPDASRQGYNRVYRKHL